MRSSIRLQLIIFAIAGCVALFILITSLLGFFSSSSPKNGGQMAPRQSPTQITTQEKEYPQATLQQFQNTNSNETGTLVVSTSTEGIIIKIDPLAIGETQGEKDLSTLPKIPTQYPPFKYVGIPAGQHTLLASKPGYLAQKISFTIAPSEITRLQISLTPLKQE